MPTFFFARLPRAAALASVALLVLTSNIAGCSSDDGGPASPSASDGGSGDETSSPSGVDGGGGSDGASDDGPTPANVRFKIQVDYRFDKAGFFADPVRKQALEGACRIWGRLLSDSFPNIPSGTFVRVRDPEKPNEAALSFDIDYEIDDLVVFVASSDLPSGALGLSSPTAGLSGITDPTLATALQKRFDESPFQPWTGWISFDSATDFYFDPNPEAPAAVPAGKVDFVSVALHEIGHVLGFGTSEAFKSQITGATFTGPKTQAAFGGPLPLAPDLGHVPNETMSGGSRFLMDVSDPAGARSKVTPADRAVFEDLGYHF